MEYKYFFKMFFFMVFGLSSNIIFSSQADPISLDSTSRNNLSMYGIRMLAPNFAEGTDIQLHSFCKINDNYQAIFKVLHQKLVKGVDNQVRVKSTYENYVASISRETLLKLGITVPAPR